MLDLLFCAYFVCDYYTENKTVDMLTVSCVNCRATCEPCTRSPWG